MRTKQILIAMLSILALSVMAQTTVAVVGGVVINEFVAAGSDRLLQRDAGGYPELGITTPWMMPEYDDLRWESGAGPFGFGTFSGVTLGVNTSADMQGQVPTLYLRKEFEVSAAQSIMAVQLQLSIRYNDGFIAFLNGVEVARRNMGHADMFAYNDQLAFNADTVDLTEIIDIGTCSDLLVEGTNVLCIQGHNKALTGGYASSFLVMADMTIATSPSALVLVANNEIWKYFVGIMEPSGGLVDYGLLEEDVATVPWGLVGFNDSAWIESAGPVGYDRGDDYVLGTNLYSEMYGITASVYARTHFVVSEADALSTLPLELIVDYDDGMIVYLNGREIVRRNVGEANTITPYSSFATGNHNASGDNNSVTVLDETIALGAANTLLVTGDNVLSIQLHNSGLTSSDMIGRATLNTTGGSAHTLAAPEDACRFFVGINEPTAVVEDDNDLEIDDLDSESDWIELYNSGSESVDLVGWSLTDNVDSPRKWYFPLGSTIQAEGYLVVMATGLEIGTDSGATYLHAEFKLDSEGEYLGLVDNTGAVVSEIGPEYPVQLPLYSYVRDTDGIYRYCDTATPGMINTGLTYSAIAPPTAFSVEGGFHESTISLHLTLPVRGGQVRYTLDGSEPSLVNGLRYSTRLAISSSTVVRARVFASDYVPSLIRTHTYLIGQPSGLQSVAAICINSDPTLSLYGPNTINGPADGEGVMAIKGGIYVDNIWQSDGDTSAYNVPLQHGRAYEKPSSLEFYPLSGVPLRTDFGLRIAGSGYSRPRYLLTTAPTSRMADRATQKPSFNLFFRNELGDSPQDYPFFPGNTVTKFEDVRLRAGKNDIRNPFIKDEFFRRLYIGTGQVGSLGVFNTLYINGVYKGYFNLCEHLRESFMQEHFNSDADWDVRQVWEFANGDAIHWNSMMTFLRASDLSDAAVYEEVHDYLDVDNFIDYLLVNSFAGMWDWPNNNWVASRERSDEGRWRFFMWDAEGGFSSSREPLLYDSFSSDLDIGSEALTTGYKMIPAIYTLLKASPEFRLRFADRAQKHFFHEGALTKSNMETQYLELRDAINPVMQATIGQTVNESFYNNWAADDTRRNAYFPQLSSYGLWVDVIAPEFSLHGGLIAAGTPISISNSNADGTIYYAINGVDPRASGGAVAGTAYVTPVAINASTILKARVLNGSGVWSPLQEAFFQVPVVTPEFLPDGNADWTADANWNSAPSPYPSGIDARALIYGPPTAKREVTLRAPVTVNNLTFSMDDCIFRNRVRDSDEINNLTFAASSGSARLTVNGSGTGFAEFEIEAGTVLATNLIITVNNPLGDSDYGALRLREDWSGPGSITKEGPGVMSMTRGTKSYTGTTVVNQGVLQVAEPGFPLQSPSFTVNSGGQLRLSTAGTAADPRVYPFGGCLYLGSFGRGGTLPDISGLGTKGGLRYQPDASDSYAVMTNKITFSGPSALHVEGSGNTLTLTGPIYGSSSFIKSGGGTLIMAADNASYFAPVIVSNGVLEVNGGLYSSVTVAEEGLISGCGQVGSLQGTGVVALDGVILQSSSAEGLDYELSFKQVGSPDYLNAAASSNSLLRLLSIYPGSTSSCINVYLDCPSFTSGDRLRGGIFVEGQSGLADFLSQATLRFYLPDANGLQSFAGRTYSIYTGTLPLTATVMPETADFGDGPRSGQVLELRVDGSAVSYNEWRQLSFPSPADLANPDVSGPMASPAGDNTSNLMRYAFDMAPYETSLDKKPFFVLEDGVPLYGFRFDPGKIDITCQLQASSSLTNWPRSLFDSAVDSLDQWDGEWILLHDSNSGPASDSKQFYRLRVLLNEAE
jgi:autotransporter-associated beta strand protein